jgi:arylformamidase
MKNPVISFLVLFILLFTSCAPSPDKGTPDYTIQYTSIPGVNANLLSLDIYNEGVTGPAPVVIWIHGGGWQTGDKTNAMEFKESLCKEQGYLLVSINYRLSAPGNGIIHPTHVQDVARAVAWVYNNIGNYGGDSTKIAVLGHSAGAHLAALVCTDETYLQNEGLDLNILSGCGSFDTQAYDVPSVMAGGGSELDLYTNAFGTNPTNWSNASPTFHVSPGKNIPPFLLARRGDSARQQICNTFADSLLASGITATVIDASSLTHEEVNDHIGAPDETIMTPSVLSFLQTIFN